MGKFDVRSRIMEGTQPGIIPFPNKGFGDILKKYKTLTNVGKLQNSGMTTPTNTLLSPSFNEVMGKHVTGTKPSLMRKYNETE